MKRTKDEIRVDFHFQIGFEEKIEVVGSEFRQNQSSERSKSRLCELPVIEKRKLHCEKLFILI